MFTELPEGQTHAYELQLCTNCMQMTNHLDGVCQKCLEKPNCIHTNEGVCDTCKSDKPSASGWDFEECDYCHGKSGSPRLCNSCINNRDLISHLRTQIAEAEKRGWLKGREEGFLNGEGYGERRERVRILDEVENKIKETSIPAPQSLHPYLEIVESGNFDKMFDRGYKIGLKQALVYITEMRNKLKK